MASTPLPWAPWQDGLAAYFILIGLASGITLVASGLSFGSTAPERRFELWASGLSLGVLASVSVILVADLGQPARFWMMLGSSNLTSPMSIGAKLIGIKALALGLDIYLLRRCLAGGQPDCVPASGPTRWFFDGVRWTLQATSFALAIYPAFLLSRTWLSPLASTPGSALLFLTTALLMGTAALILVAATVGLSPVQTRLHRWLRTLIVLEAAALVFEGLALYGGDAASVALFRATTQGRFGLTFWGAVIAGGLVLPLVTRIAGRCSTRAMSLDAVAIMIGAAATRYLMFWAR